jgi:hypothetical protein
MNVPSSRTNSKMATTPRCWLDTAAAEGPCFRPAQQQPDSDSSWRRAQSAQSPLWPLTKQMRVPCVAQGPLGDAMAISCVSACGTCPLPILVARAQSLVRRVLTRCAY